MVLTLQHTEAGQSKPSFVVVGVAEAPPTGNWTVVRGVVEIESSSSAASGDAAPVFFAEALMGGITVELKEVSVRRPWAIPAAEAQIYTPCEIDPAIAPDGVFFVDADSDHVVDARVCSIGYDQSLRVYDADSGALVAQTDPTCGRSFELSGLQLSKGRRYAFVVDGTYGEPYGSWRGGHGIHVIRRDGRPFLGKFNEAPKPAALGHFVRAVNNSFFLGCDPYLFVGCNTWDLMDTARHDSGKRLVNKRMDDMKARKLTVGRTWAFSLGTGENADGRAQALQLKPGVYDEEARTHNPATHTHPPPHILLSPCPPPTTAFISKLLLRLASCQSPQVFRGLDYALVQAKLRGIKLILAIEDYWLSVSRYLEWSPTAGSKTDFYTGARSMSESPCCCPGWLAAVR